MLTRQADAGQPRARLQDPREHLPQRQFALLGTAQHLANTQLLSNLIHGRHRTDR